MRTTLVSALSSCVGNQKRRKARQFLEGLSADELQYIADFLGACILEAADRPACTRGQLAEGITQFERRRQAACRVLELPHDIDHKMILLLEYLCRCGLTQFSLQVRAGQT